MLDGEGCCLQRIIDDNKLIYSKYQPLVVGWIFVCIRCSRESYVNTILPHKIHRCTSKVHRYLIHSALDWMSWRISVKIRTRCLLTWEERQISKTQHRSIVKPGQLHLYSFRSISFSSHLLHWVTDGINGRIEKLLHLQVWIVYCRCYTMLVLSINRMMIFNVITITFLRCCFSSSNLL